MLARLHILASLALLAAACGSDPNGNGTGGDGGNNGGGDGGQKIVDDAGHVITVDASLIGPVCGNMTSPIATQRVVTPPDVLIVLDKSGSMNMAFAGGAAGQTRWTAMRTALETMTAAQQTNVKFGLAMYPSDDMCGVNAGVGVGINLSTAPAIATLLNGANPGGRTPTPAALTNAKTYFDARMPVNPAGRFVLLATDGEPNCAPGNNTGVTITQSLAAVTALKGAGIKTFVIGVVGDFTSTGNQFLNDAATQGGTARAGATKYYPVTNQTDLQAALDTIAGSIQMPSCVFQLAMAPPVPDNIFVGIGGVAVPRSTMHTDGWDYSPDATHITFFGSSCTAITNGGATNVNFVYGCPGPKIN